MEKVWVLSIKTSLPNTCKNKERLRTTMTAFTDFESAKNAFRETIKHYAFSNNSMFDGNGNIKMLNEYLNNRDSDEIDDFEDDFGDFLTRDTLLSVYNSLLEIFKGNDTTISLPSCEFTDYMICLKYNGYRIIIEGDFDGPCNGYDPYIKTNAFSMAEEKDYYLYIDDLFGQEDYASELYIDLKQVEVK